jgi:hypothetical protein
MRTMIAICALLAALATIDAGSSNAHAAAWCAKYFGHGGTNCGFYTYAQCQVTVSGIGGFCEPNLLEAPRYYEEPRRYRRYRY